MMAATNHFKGLSQLELANENIVLLCLCTHAIGNRIIDRSCLSVNLLSSTVKPIGTRPGGQLSRTLQFQSYLKIPTPRMVASYHWFYRSSTHRFDSCPFLSCFFAYQVLFSRAFSQKRITYTSPFVSVTICSHFAFKRFM